MSHPMRDFRKLKESLEQSVRQIEAKKGVDYQVIDSPVDFDGGHKEKILILRHTDLISVAHLAQWELVGEISRKSFGRFCFHEEALKAKVKLEQPPRSRIGQYILGACVAAIALAIATSVFAGPIKIIDTGVYVEMVGVDAGYVVEYHNDLSHVVEPAPFPLDVDGVEAVVSLHLQSGNTPDYLSVSPPVGFYCDPCSLSVKEGEIGQIFLYPMGLS